MTSPAVRLDERSRLDAGPIVDGQQLSAVLGGRPMTAAILERADLAPSEANGARGSGRLRKA